MPGEKKQLLQIQDRLIALVDNRKFRFHETSRKTAEEYLGEIRTFEGFTDEEIAYAEQSLGVQFPTFYREFLSQMGMQSGTLFNEYDLPGPKDFEKFVDDGNALLERDGSSERLPKNAVVVLSYGSAFTFIIGDGGFDSFIASYNKGHMEFDAPETNTFADLIEHTVSLKEENHRDSNGYFLKVYENGGMGRSYGEPTTDKEDQFTDDV